MAKDRRGKHGTRKVAVPDLSTLLIADARTALTNLGLNYSDSSTNTGTSGDNNKVFQQSPAAGTIVILGSTVSIGYYTYVAPPYFPYFPFFPPSFPYFPFFPDFPPAPSFPYFKAGKTGCIGENTLLLKNDYTEVQAKNIQVGDLILTIDPENFGNGILANINLLPKVKLIEVKIISIEPSIKDVYSINNEGSYLSGSQPIFIKENNVIKYINVSDLKIGDTVISIDNNGSISYILVESINEIKNSTVYDIRTEPYQWFIAGNHLVIS